MSTPFVGEIRMFGGNFAPAGWAFCQGQTLPISQYNTLYQLIGTTYGGNGTTTFNLPDLRGRVPVHQGNAFVMGALAGEENHTLTTSELPSHSHTVSACNQATTTVPTGNLYGGGGLTIYRAAAGATMAAGAVQNNAGGQPHPNLMPFLAISFIISLFGIYPSQN
jgi:microcystin-dependent protein